MQERDSAAQHACELARNVVDLLERIGSRLRSGENPDVLIPVDCASPGFLVDHEDVVVCDDDEINLVCGSTR